MNFISTACVAVVLFLGLSIPFVFSVLVAITATVFFNFAFIIRYRINYYKFLAQIGEPCTNSEFYKEEYSMSVVPFQGHALACLARVQKDKLMFGRSRHYRVIELDKVNSFEFENFFGHKVAKITLENNSNTQVDLYMPWTDLLKQEVELCESTNKLMDNSDDN